MKSVAPHFATRFAPLTPAQKAAQQLLDLCAVIKEEWPNCDKQGYYQHYDGQFHDDILEVDRIERTLEKIKKGETLMGSPDIKQTVSKMNGWLHHRQHYDIDTKYSKEPPKKTEAKTRKTVFGLMDAYNRASDAAQRAGLYTEGKTLAPNLTTEELKGQVAALQARVDKLEGKGRVR